MVIPLISWTAVSAGIFSSIFMIIIRRAIVADETFATENEDIENVANYMAFFVMIVLGVAGILGGQLMAYVKDHSAPSMPIILQIVMTVVAYVFLIWFNERNKFDWLTYVFVFFFGL